MDSPKCLICQKQFKPKTKTHKVCGPECRVKYKLDYQKEYSKKPKVIEKMRQLRQTSHYKDYQKKYHESEEYKTQQLKYRQTPDS